MCSCSFPQPLEQLGCFVCARFTSYSGSLNKLRQAILCPFVILQFDGIGGGSYDGGGRSLVRSTLDRSK
jgi:hypothetical protein